jgi:formylglycine-generating enzyme required for sulfatase activity
MRTIRSSYLPSVAGIVALLTVAGCDRDPATGASDLTLTVECVTNGSVSADPGLGPLPSGSQVTLTATADSGYVFAGWTGDIVSPVNPLTVVLDHSLTVCARLLPRPAGMVLVPLAGQTVTIGSTSSRATQDERPPHPVRFTYDILMDATEVTQASFARFMGDSARTAALGAGAYGRGDSIAMYSVSWYDAVLYCNARSKAEGLDTVYTYSARCVSAGGCAYVLENLSIRYDRFGYRLPTESEWEAACRAGTGGDFYWGNADSGEQRAPTYAWYVQNAGGVVNPVARKPPNLLGLYDMAGNVSEWVNDWLAPYPDSQVTDPFGPDHLPLAEFEQGWERPVRGGCWELEASFLRSSARKGPYALAARTAKRSVGFRAVLGAFVPDTSRAWRPPAQDTAGGVSLKAAKSQLVGAVGTSEVKLVFTARVGGRERLGLVDFTAAAPAVVWLDDTLPVICPTISPDGRSVAYGSRREGFADGSRVSVRELDTSTEAITRTPEGSDAFLPRWWSDTLDGSPWIVYTDGASLSGSLAWSSERTWRAPVSGLSIGAPVELAAWGSFHGGMSADGWFLATGFPNAYVFSLFTNSVAQYFIPPQNGTTDTLQVCNVSISPGIMSVEEVLLLDFGTTQTSSVVGRPYTMHEFLFLCKSGATTSGHVKSWYEKHAGSESWSDVEYSNHPDVAAGIGYQADTQSVYLIDLADSAYVELVRGPGLRDPYLWIDPVELPQIPDPYAWFGRYDVPTIWFGQVVMTGKMRLFWRRRSSLESVVIGSSSAHYGINTAYLSRPALNMSTCGHDTYTGIVVVREHVLRHSPNLRAVCMTLDPGFFGQDPYPLSPFLTGIGDSKGFVLDRDNTFWQDSMPAPVAQRIAGYATEDWMGADTMGSPLEHGTNGWGDAVVLWPDYAFTDSIVQMNLSILSAFADTLAARGVHLLMVNTPQHPGYRDTSFVAQYGPSDTTFARLEQWLRDKEGVNAHFHYYDANLGGLHDYTDADAMDAFHLSPAGAAKLSARIDSVLVSLGAW